MDQILKDHVREIFSLSHVSASVLAGLMRGFIGPDPANTPHPMKAGQLPAQSLCRIVEKGTFFRGPSMIQGIEKIIVIE